MIKKTKRRNYRSKRKTKKLRKSRVKRQVKRKVKNRTKKRNQLARKSLRGGAQRAEQSRMIVIRNEGIKCYASPKGGHFKTKYGIYPKDQILDVTGSAVTGWPGRAWYKTKTDPGDPSDHARKCDEEECWFKGSSKNGFPNIKTAESTEEAGEDGEAGEAGEAGDIWAEDVVTDHPFSARDETEVGIISGHGAQIKGEFTIVPEGMTFHFYSSSGEYTDRSARHLTNVSSRPEILAKEISGVRERIRGLETTLESYIAGGSDTEEIRELRGEIDENKAFLEKLESNDYFFREYQSGALIPNYYVNFNKLFKIFVGQDSWLDAGIFTKDVDTFLSEEPRKSDAIHYSLDDSLEEHRKARYMSLDTKTPMRFKLSNLFKIITEKEDRPSNWFGAFCRSGDNFDTVNLLDCRIGDLANLSPDFFAASRGTKPPTDREKFKRKHSLALDVRTQNFKGILDKVAEMAPETMEKYTDATERFLPLSTQDVCLILLLYNTHFVMKR